MTYPFLLELSFGELIPTGYVIYFSWLPQTPLSIITQALPGLYVVVEISGPSVARKKETARLL